MRGRAWRVITDLAILGAMLAVEHGEREASVAAAAGHRLNDARSLVYHRVIADRVMAHPELLEAAARRVAQWKRDGSVAAFYVERWARLLVMPPADACAALVDSSEEADALRQVSPFAGVLTPQERWALWRQTRAPQGA